MIRTSTLGDVVPDVVGNDGFGFLGRSSGSLFDDRLLGSLFAKVVESSVQYALDRGDVGVEAKVAEPLVSLGGRCLK